MNPRTERRAVAGPAGSLECAIDAPAHGSGRGLAVLCHPHPLHGGTLDNKIVQTLARTFVALGYTAVRFNFRGIGASAGHWDHGLGEVDDALAVIHAHRGLGQPLVLGGFSFGGYVASQAAARLPAGEQAERLVLVGPAVQTFPMVPVPADTLVIHGEADEVVPLGAVFDWARPQSLPVTVVPGAGHFFHGQLTLLKHIVTGAWHPRTFS
ncbi:MAG: alpha/beta fold hydrolase [Rubrivivax sp.]|jgi:alpha/beta superfamily hydrolase|nr:alpha/beta fold hydrolase [Betaproteobacteria bacterium]MBP6318082.1 alpha/beta fold hydrolase [Rubrivivax sp.]MBK7277985.1 alpha/beta fold hydrolase [Betaproteobacteria bacterium]MBK7457083.1 alpha/beta fold hydrolase [Betaproteobacteria bacterium]MBK7518199.1 alpha/beta fold hydrolase [Betaproteobacteria bacterium]